MYKTYSDDASAFCNLYTVRRAIALCMTQPSDRLRQARIRKGFAQTIDASTAYGWNKNTYASNENGNAPFSFKSAQKYAAAFGVRAEWLYSGAGPMVDDTPVEIEGAQPVAQVPIIGRVQAGNWREAVQHATGFIEVAKADAPKDAFALRVVGSSMNLHVPEGYTVIINPNDKALFPAKLYIILNEEGEATFKEYQENPARLVPCSTEEHDVIPLGDRAFTVIGRVVTSTRRH